MTNPFRSKTNVDGANFKFAANELQRLAEEQTELPEPPGMEDGQIQSAPPPPQSQTIAPPPPKQQAKEECPEKTCAEAFQEASSKGLPFVRRGGQSC